MGERKVEAGCSLRGRVCKLVRPQLGASCDQLGDGGQGFSGFGIGRVLLEDGGEVWSGVNWNANGKELGK
jgi:hypothetical protein